MQKLDAKTGRIALVSALISSGVILVDQYSKWFVLEKLLRKGDDAPAFCAWFTTATPLSWFVEHEDKYRTDILAPFLNLVMVWNRGISFGVLDVSDAPPPILFIALSLAIAAVLLTWMLFTRRPVITVAASLIVGGAVANVIDRIRFGAVADFIDFHIGDRHWPAFNAADSCIVLGAALLIADSLLARDSKAAAPAKQA